MNPRKHFVANLAGAITTVASPLKTRKLGGGDGPLGFSDVLLTAYTAGLRYAEHCGRPRVPGGRAAALMAVCWPRVAVSQSRIVCEFMLVLFSGIRCTQKVNSRVRTVVTGSTSVWT